MHLVHLIVDTGLDSFILLMQNVPLCFQLLSSNSIASYKVAQVAAAVMKGGCLVGQMQLISDWLSICEQSLLTGYSSILITVGSRCEVNCKSVDFLHGSR